MEHDGIMEGQSAAIEGPLAPVESENPDNQEQPAPDPDISDEAMQQADDWLNEMSNVFDFEWLQQETGPSPLTSIATDPRTAAGRVYKSCRCPTHQGLYDNWPTENAELTIVKCMKICMYCGKDFRTAAEVRRYIHEGLKYAKRNLRVRYGPQVTRGLHEPGWAHISQTDMPFGYERLRLRSNRNRLLADGADRVQPS
jgi:hypothetical protein